ncbi:hypothetical protein C7212DRAFT_355176 [Tuber magnatum]|uniref:Uncharacterized protein n=1 Tax=Tuber magnatum TaxID=42249 RepID=A0A317SDM0_9PEZI|nr:hypothetical protein C7212DRAFT_355176 [Tuber magnatum]
MERLRGWWKLTYEPFEDQDEREDVSSPKAQHVSWFEYFVFLSLGVAMLRSRNTFMAYATYFQCRFTKNEFLLNNFQSLILVLSTITNLGSAVYFSICASLEINCAVFTVLALSAVIFQVGPEAYIMVLLACVLCTSWSAGLNQNGIFAFVNKRPLSLRVPRGSTASPKSAFIYFPTATSISRSSLLLFLLLLSRHRISPHKSWSDITDSEDHAPVMHTQVSLWVLLKKLEFLSFAIWLCFLVTIIFPVHSQVILSVHLEDTSLRMFKPDVFIPIGFTCDRPKLLTLVSIARLVYITSYTICNIKGHRAVISSDLFYWLVQFTFEISNGRVGSNKEASGSFMGMCLVAGLRTGSFPSFLIVNV